MVSNEGTGTLVLVDLNSNAVVGRIRAVHTNLGDDDDQDDHSDRHSANAPSIQSLSPATGKAGTTFTLTVAGANLTGTTSVIFVDERQHGNGNNGQKPDTAFTVTNTQVAAGGTQLTATVSIAASASPGARMVLVTTGKGDSSDKTALANTFTITP